MALIACNICAGPPYPAGSQITERHFQCWRIVWAAINGSSCPKVVSAVEEMAERWISKLDNSNKLPAMGRDSIAMMGYFVNCWWNSVTLDTITCGEKANGDGVPAGKWRQVGHTE